MVYELVAIVFVRAAVVAGSKMSTIAIAMAIGNGC
jgi:hypothetical protein